MAEDIKEETPEVAPETSPAPKKKKNKLAIVGIVVGVIVVLGIGLFVWHEQPSFCNAICHTPMDAYGDTYLKGNVDKYGNELALDKIVEDASKQEPLRNIAHANVELDGSDGTPVLTYDDTTLEDGVDYETVETDDSQVVFVGKGAYTGTTTLG